jgi:hypothetical protein
VDRPTAIIGQSGPAIRIPRFIGLPHGVYKTPQGAETTLPRMPGSSGNRSDVTIPLNRGVDVRPRNTAARGGLACILVCATDPIRRAAPCDRCVLHGRASRSRGAGYHKPGPAVSAHSRHHLLGRSALQFRRTAKEWWGCLHRVDISNHLRSSVSKFNAASRQRRPCGLSPGRRLS